MLTPVGSLTGCSPHRLPPTDGVPEGGASSPILSVPRSWNRAVHFGGEAVHVDTGLGTLTHAACKRDLVSASACELPAGLAETLAQFDGRIQGSTPPGCAVRPSDDVVAEQCLTGSEIWFGSRV